MKNYCHLWGAGVYVKAESAYSRIRTWACPAGGASPWHWVGRDAVVLLLLYIEQLIYLFHRNFMSCVWMSCVVHVVNVTVICVCCEYFCMYRSLDWTYYWITDYTSFPYLFWILFLHSFISTSLHICIGYHSFHILDHSFTCHVIIFRLSISISLSILLSHYLSYSFCHLGGNICIWCLSVNHNVITVGLVFEYNGCTDICITERRSSLMWWA